VNPEILATALLWVMMPLDATPHFPPARPEDLAYFPAANVARREYREAKRRKDYASQQYADVYKWGREGERQERIWWHVRLVAEQSERAWSHLDDAHRAPCPTYRLNSLRERIGPANYYAGQMPAPVYVPGMPTRRAGDK
jgi:hypothetical protein